MFQATTCARGVKTAVVFSGSPIRHVSVASTLWWRGFSPGRRNISTIKPPPRTKLSPARPSGFSLASRISTRISPKITQQTLAMMANGRTAPYSDGVVVVTDVMEKPSLDIRSYRVIRLANQLEVLLIHDPETDKASAALDVNVGSFSDPKDMPGLAHAVEHMLFMGTEKYPQENDYNEYLAAHNGSSNAYTAFTSTNYYFEVSASDSPSNSKQSSQVDLNSSQPESSFYGALDRFAQFFVHSLFLEDTLDREIRSVDSENKKNLQSDVWRLHQLQQSLSNPDHPFCHFSTGNWDTLHEIPLKRGQNLRDEFMRFYQTHYSANRMKLVVLGRESLNELQAWVTELFTPIKNQNLPQLRWDQIPLWTPKELKTQILAKPVIDSRYVELYFPFPDDEELFESQPSGYLSHLIGHEGPGSLLAFLREKGWATELSAGAEDVCPGTNYFYVQVRLTEDGLTQYTEVLKYFFQYIAMLRETPPLKWVFDEQKIMSEVNFKFKQTQRASKTTSNLSSVMQQSKYPRHRLLSARSVLKTFDPKAISEGLDCIRPDQCRFTIVSQNYPGSWDSKEEWYGTEYRYTQIPEEIQVLITKAYNSTASQRSPEIHLPHKNEFIPTRLEVERKEIKTPAKAPKLIRNDEFVRTWFKKDDQFWVPKAYINVSLRTPLAYITPRCSIMTQLYCEMVRDALNEYSYDAELAGLGYSLSSDALGLEISVSGYNDKMGVLLEKVLHSMVGLKFKDSRYDIVKERLVRGLKNWGFRQPYQQIGQFRSWLNTERSWTNEHYAAEIGSISANDIREFFPQVLAQLHIEALAHGNLHKEDALQFTDLCQQILKPHGLPPSLWPIRRSLIMPEGSDYVYERPLADAANVNHCIEYVLWAGSNWDRPLRVKALLAAQLADEPCYDQLRTKEQLGYVVFSSALASLHRIGFRILVQSEKAPEYLEGRIDNFLNSFGKMIEELDDTKFEKHKNSLINKLKEKPKNLKEEMERLWMHITTEYFDFDQPEADSAEIEKLTKADLLEFFNNHMSTTSSKRTKLCVHLIAQGQAQAAKLTSSEKLAKLEEKLAELLEEQDITVDEKFKTRIQSIDTETADVESVAKVLQDYLINDLEYEDDEVEELMESGKPMLGSLLVSSGIQKPVEEAPVNGATTRKATVVADVHKYKAQLLATAGPRPVRDIVEFEDIEPKL